MDINELTQEGSFTKILNVQNNADSNEFALLGRALSSPIRIEILKLLMQKPMLLSQIADKLDLQLSSVAFHLKTLEEAHLIMSENSTKGKGKLKIYTYSQYKFIVLQLFGVPNEGKKNIPYVLNVPIGDYVDAHFARACGIASEKLLFLEDRPHDIFRPERHTAQILWTKPHGFVKYAVPNAYAETGSVAEVSFSMELCSEAHGYNANYPTDVTFYINDVELCTWTCPGDFGDRYGKFTPSWWFSESTKYGLLTNVSVRKNGVYLNGELVNKRVTIADLRLSEGNSTTFTIAVKKDAEHLGGFNLFGEKFGDYNQPIVFTAIPDSNA